jgi:hypothetical protein
MVFFQCPDDTYMSSATRPATTEDKGDFLGIKGIEIMKYEI